METAECIHPDEIVAQALNFLVSHEPMLTRFFNLTGLRADTIRAAAQQPDFSASVLDHFLNDETLLLQFCGASGVSIAAVQDVRRQLGPQAESERPHTSKVTAPTRELFHWG